FGFLSRMATPHLGGSALGHSSELRPIPKLEPGAAAPVIASSLPIASRSAVATSPVVVPSAAPQGSTRAAAPNGAPAHPLHANSKHDVAEPRAAHADAVGDARVGSLLVSASSGQGEIFENGALLARTPARLSLPAGRHVLTVRPSGGGAEHT